MNLEAVLLKELSKFEVDSGVYSIRINGYSLYSLLRQDFRQCYLRNHDISIMSLRSKKKIIVSIWSFLCSSVQLLKIIISRKKTENLIIAFPRLDSISGKYVDKFTDPVIDFSEIGSDFIIFEHGRGGQHLTPRYHSHDIVWIDALAIISSIVSHIWIWHFRKKNSDIITSFFSKVNTFVNPQWYCRSAYERRLYENLIYGRMYEFLLSNLSVKNLFSVTRPVVEFTAANKLDIRSFEFQHGITYNETILYSGYRDESIMPKYFLAFGNNEPNDVYGVSTDRIMIIGWAFSHFLKKISSPIHPGVKDVLVVSDPEVTDAIIDAVSTLANAFPDSTFYLRPHPLEHYNERQLNAISKKNNILIQDNRINIGLILQSFTYVIGESSSVLYEALSNGNMVGKLFMNGLSPMYLQKTDNKAFCEIHDVNDFRLFIEGKWRPEVFKSIYSPFDASKINMILNSFDK